MEDLVIAKFDTTVNDVVGLKVRSNPTIVFYPKEKKEGIEYDGERQLSAFQTWLSENSSAYQKFRPRSEPIP